MLLEEIAIRNKKNPRKTSIFFPIKPVVGTYGR